VTRRLAPLPALTAEELDVLVLALITYQGELDIQVTFKVPGAPQAHHITRSLLTAASEARESLREPT